VKSASFREIVPISFNGTEAVLTHVQMEYTEEDPEVYVLPLAVASGDRAEQVCESSSNVVLATITVKDKEGEKSGCLYDAVFDKEFCKSLVNMIAGRRSLRGTAGDFVASPTRTLRDGRLG